MTIFRTDIEINTSADMVFKALCDFEGYPEWHPGIQNISGEPGLNNWITLHMAGPEKKRAIPIPVEITVLMENKALEWQGSLFKSGPLRKYFLVRHAFYVEALSDTRCRFTNEEQFYYLLSWPIARMRASFIKAYQGVNEALKGYCESQQKSPA